MVHSWSIIWKNSPRTRILHFIALPGVPSNCCKCMGHCLCGCLRALATSVMLIGWALDSFAPPTPQEQAFFLYKKTTFNEAQKMLLTKCMINTLASMHIWLICHLRVFFLFQATLTKFIPSPATIAMRCSTSFFRTDNHYPNWFGIPDRCLILTHCSV